MYTTLMTSSIRQVYATCYGQSIYGQFGSLFLIFVWHVIMWIITLTDLNELNPSSWVYQWLYSECHLVCNFMSWLRIYSECFSATLLQWYAKWATGSLKPMTLFHRWQLNFKNKKIYLEIDFMLFWHIPLPQNEERTLFQVILINMSHCIDSCWLYVIWPSQVFFV